MSVTPPILKVLLFAAEPSDLARLRLGKELREIQECRQRATARDRFAVDQSLATRTSDLRRQMLDVQPAIVHFSGHGAGPGGLALEDDRGRTRLVEAEVLADLFRLFEGQVRCVVLNSCFSAEQARAIGRHVPHVVGMKQEIGDQAAIHFSIGFYDALFAGQSPRRAFDSGRLAIRLESLPEAVKSNLPDRDVMKKDRVGVEALPEYLKPTLFYKGEPVDPSSPGGEDEGGLIQDRPSPGWRSAVVGAVAVGAVAVLAVGIGIAMQRSPGPVPPKDNPKTVVSSVDTAGKTLVKTPVPLEEVGPGSTAVTVAPAHLNPISARRHDLGKSWRDQLWPMRKTLNARFLDEGDDPWLKHVRQRIQDLAPQWTKGTNLTLRFSDEQPIKAADILIKLTPGMGIDYGASFSYLGNQSLQSTRSGSPSLALCFPPDYPDEDLQQHILHEFGHAFGLIEEHLNPNANIDWDEAAVYQYFLTQNPQTDREWIKRLILTRSPYGEYTDYRPFDPDSIMIFRFPPGLTKNGFSSEGRRTLSDGDRRFIAELYPPDALALGGTAVEGTLQRPGQVDSYRFEAEVTARYRVDLGGVSQAEACLFGPEEKNKPFTKQDDGEPLYSSKIVRNLESGTYFVKVRLTRLDATGAYTIGVVKD